MELTGLQPDADIVASDATSSASGRWFTGALLGLTSASGQLRYQRVRSSFARLVNSTSVSGRASRMDGVRTCASGPCDQHVRSARLLRNLMPNGSIRRGTSINTHWPDLSSNSSILWHTCEHFELSNTPPTYLSCFFAYSKWDWVI
jgi:hypothetical protein